MLKAHGLKTHIWNNNLRSILLLSLFPLLILCLAYGLFLLWIAYTSSRSFDDSLRYATTNLPTLVPVTLGLTGGWFGVAFFGHQQMISHATQSRPLTLSEEPRAYRMLENLCISRGLTMPRLNVIETSEMNAFASGVRDKDYQITLTRGLMDRLDDAELNAVIAHELSHIQHKDVRTLIIAIIFVGVFTFFGEGIVRTMFRTNLGRTNTHRRSGGGNAGALIFLAFAIIAVSYLLAILVRFTLSRKREYMADAGAVELTRDPDAMIRALERISGMGPPIKSAGAALDGLPPDISEMAIYNPPIGFSGLFSTHPPIEKRIDVLVKYAGGRTGTQSQPHPRAYRPRPITPPDRWF